MSLAGARSPDENAISCVVIIWLVVFEIKYTGPVTATLPPEKTGFSKRTISHIVDHLFRAVYSNRQLNQFDARSHLLSLILPDDYTAAVQVLFSPYFFT